MMSEHTLDPDTNPASSDLDNLRASLIGSWRLVSYVARAVDLDPTDPAATIYPLGEQASGLILYTADGFMSAQIMQAGRHPYHDAGPSAGTTDESADAARGYLAYSGRYYLTTDDTGAPVVRHEPAVSLFPNWVGTSEGRHVAVHDTRLELSTTQPVLFEGHRRDAALVWERTTSTDHTAGEQ